MLLKLNSQDDAGRSKLNREVMENGDVLENQTSLVTVFVLLSMLNQPNNWDEKHFLLLFEGLEIRSQAQQSMIVRTVTETLMRNT